MCVNNGRIIKWYVYRIILYLLGILGWSLACAKLLSLEHGGMVVGIDLLPFREIDNVARIEGTANVSSKRYFFVFRPALTVSINIIR